MRVEGLTDQDIETVPTGATMQPVATNDGDAADSSDGDAADTSDGDAADSSDGADSDGADADGADADGTDT